MTLLSKTLVGLVLLVLAAGVGFLAGSQRRSPVSVPRAKEPTAEANFSPEVLAQARAVGHEARDSVVLLRKKSDDPAEGGGVGTAWFVSPTILATAGHSVEKGLRAEAETLDGKTFTVEGLGRSLIPDMGAFKAIGFEGRPLPLGDSKKIRPEQPLVQVGHPGRIGQWVISLGKAVEGWDGRGEWFLSNVPTEGGASGSPVLTLEGEVVGITSGSTGGALPEGARGSDQVYLSFPEAESLTTHTPVERLTEKLKQWQ